MRIVTDTGQAELSITLVHGTWGRGCFPAKPSSAPPAARRKPRWFEPGSTFRASLEEALTNDASGHAVSIGCFEWSGANSFIERSNAGEALAQRLDAEAAARPGQTQILIGHSHGGSVCMRACVSMETARPHIVTLATPFIELDASDPGTRTFAAACADQVRRLSFTAFFYFIGIAVIGVTTSQLEVAWLKSWWAPYVLALPFAYVGLNVWERWSRTHLDPEWAVGGLMQRHASTRMLVLRGIDDEATMALTAAAIANRLCQPFPFLAALALYVGLLALVLINAFGIELAHVDSHLIASTAMSWLPLVWLLDPITGLLMATSGRELAIWFHGLQIRSHSSPDHGHHLSVITLPYLGRRGLWRHSLYDHALASAFIFLWMKNGFDLCPVDLDVAVSPDGGVRVSLLAKEA